MARGIILAGGSGTRLHPVTIAVSKHLVPIYDKPMIHYPLSTLMLAGIREILVISTPDDQSRFQKALGNGSQWGISIDYAIQEHPGGLAEAFIIGEEFIGRENCALALGDNLFFGTEILPLMRQAAQRQNGATVFAYRVADPERYGVVVMSEDHRPVRLVEKPREHVSNLAITGLYFYDNDVVKYAKSLKPSDRGELEITDLNSIYLNEGKMQVAMLGRGVAWLDTGTPDSLLEASQFVAAIEKRQGLKIACLEEVAYRMGYIDKASLIELTEALKNQSYREYLQSIVDESASAVPFAVESIDGANGETSDPPIDVERSR